MGDSQRLKTMVKTSSLRLIGAAAVFASLALGNDDIPDPESDVPVDDAVEEPAAAADEDDAAPASPEIACEDYVIADTSMSSWSTECVLKFLQNVENDGDKKYSTANLYKIIADKKVDGAQLATMKGPQFDAIGITEKDDQGRILYNVGQAQKSQDVSGIFPFLILLALGAYVIYSFFLPKRSWEKVDRMIAKYNGSASSTGNNGGSSSGSAGSSDDGGWLTKEMLDAQTQRGGVN